LFTILHNTARNRFRDRARDIVSADSDAVDRATENPGHASPPGSPANLGNPELELLRQTLTPELQAAMDELPPAFREAVWLRDVEEFTYSEISEMLNVPIGTVMSRISRGRHLLYEKLSPQRAPALTGESK